MNLATAKRILPKALYEEILKKYKVALVCKSAPAMRGTTGDNTARRPAHLERTSGNEPLAAEKGARYSTPVSISVLSIRKRFADPDGVSAKAVIDGLRHCGVLSDDTAAQISEVRYSQTHCKKGEEEHTIITITPEITL